MELGQLAVLLSVLIEPGLRAQDLTARVGLRKSSLSRNVKSLSAASYLSDEEGHLRDGLDLITQTPDAVDGRAFQLSPTPKGWTLAKTLSKILKSRPSARP